MRTLDTLHGAGRPQMSHNSQTDLQVWWPRPYRLVCPYAYVVRLNDAGEAVEAQQVRVPDWMVTFPSSLPSGWTPPNVIEFQRTSIPPDGALVIANMVRDRSDVLEKPWRVTDP